MSFLFLTTATRCRNCDSPHWSETADCILCGAAICDQCAVNFTPAIGRDAGKDLYICQRCAPEFTECAFCGSHRRHIAEDRKLNRQPEAVCCETNIEDYIKRAKGESGIWQLPATMSAVRRATELHFTPAHYDAVETYVRGLGRKEITRFDVEHVAVSIRIIPTPAETR